MQNHTEVVFSCRLQHGSYMCLICIFFFGMVCSPFANLFVLDGYTLNLSIFPLLALIALICSRSSIIFLLLINQGDGKGATLHLSIEIFSSSPPFYHTPSWLHSFSLCLPQGSTHGSSSVRENVNSSLVPRVCFLTFS